MPPKPDRAIDPPPRPRRGRRSPTRRSVLFGAVSVLLAPACANNNRSNRARRLRPKFVGRAASGRPDTCPEGAVDPFGDGTPGPDDLRCSYRDVPGGSVVEIRGQVITEPDGAAPGRGVADTEVVITGTVDGGPPKVLARTTTDAQGSFSLAAMLPPGRYALALAGRPATARTLEVQGNGDDPDDLVLIVPKPVAESP